ncbi:MAG: hypothetical protein K2N72_07290 [Oscillospiraceae bacterium]|nr:hypothetical protein [Oscillospiraceae bacterium]
MESIIKSIIDIDRGASQKLEDAEKERMRILGSAKEKEESIIKEALEKSKRDLERLENEERKKSEEKLAAIKEENDRKVKAMQQSFEKNSERWRDEIFEAIING